MRPPPRSGTIRARAHLAYVLDSWPRLSEQFIVREIAYVAARHDVRILALTKSDEKPSSSEAAALSRLVTYLPKAGGGGDWLRAVGYGFRRPQRGAGAWAAAARGASESAVSRLPALLAVADKWVAWGVERVHGHFARWATSAADVLATAAGVPFGFTAHAYDVFVSPVRLAGKINRSQWAITCTLSAKKEIERTTDAVVASRVRVIRHGVDVEEYQPGRPPDVPRVPGPLRVLAVGRLVEKKGFHRLLDALDLLRTSRVPVEVRLIGDGPESAALHARAEELHLVGDGGPMQFLPPCSPVAVREAMKTWADVLVAPSIVAHDGDRDGIPNVVGEALACGLPVVGTTNGGLPEIVFDGKNGIVAADGDATAVAAAIERLAEDAELRARLALGARATACEKFDASKNLAEFLRVLEAGDLHA